MSASAVFNNTSIQRYQKIVDYSMTKWSNYVFKYTVNDFHAKTHSLQ